MKQVIFFTFILCFVALVKGQSCYISLDGVDNDSCGNKTTSACATILQCLENSPSSNKTFYNAIDIVILPGTYSGNGFCDLELVGFVSIADYNGSVTIDCKRKSRHFELKAIENSFASAISIAGINFINGFSENGGSLYIYPQQHFTVVINNCTFTGNSANNSGGAIFSESGDEWTQIQMSNVQFYNNNAQYGGAAYVTGLSFLTNCTFVNNTATYGGACYIYGGSEMNTCTFSYNAATDGGAVFISSGISFAQSISMSVFEYNVAENMGGAIYMEANYYSPELVYEFNAVTVIYNNATKGGAFAVGPTGETYLKYYFQYSNISSNFAQEGGAGWICSKNSLSQTHMYNWFFTSIENNVAATEGGGLYIDFTNDTNGDSFDLQGITMSNNMPNNLRCSEKVPFCQGCQTVVCSDCPSVCVPSHGEVAPFCYSPQNDIACDNGVCMFGPSQIAQCSCVVGWTGTTCDQKEGQKPNNNDTWIYVVISVAVVASIAVAVIIFLRRRRQRHNYAPIH